MGKLGRQGFISFGVADLDLASAFFQNIGFNTHGGTHRPDQVGLFDGSALLQCRLSDAPDAEFLYFSDRIRDTGRFPGSLPAHTKSEREISFQSPHGLGVRIHPRGTDCAELPPGLTLHRLPIHRILNPALYPNPICGIFVAFICPVEDIGESIAYWERLGFDLLETHQGPYPNVTLSDGVFNIGLHQTRGMEGNGLLYAAPDMSLRLAHLETKGMLKIRRNPTKGRKTYDACIIGPDGIRIYLAGF